MEPSNTTTDCPGCGRKLDRPYEAGGDTGRSWLDRDAWCKGCGGSATTARRDTK